MSQKVYDTHAKGWIAPPLCSPVSTCDSRNCLCCKTLMVNSIYKSFTTGCTFAFKNTKSFNCKSSFVIYLISCLKCGVQYVGQTRQPLHKRLNGHRSSILQNKLSTYLCQHFNSPGHCFEDVSIQIIDFVDVSKMSFEQAAAELNVKEDYHMRTLNTFFPIGLNDRVQGGGCVSQGTQEDCLFYSNPITRRKRSHGVRRSHNGKNRKRIGNKDSISWCQFVRKLFEEKKYAEFYRTLRSITNDVLKGIYRLLINEGSDFSCVFTSFYFWRFGQQETRIVGERATFVVNFNCRNLDSINFPAIFTNKEVSCLFPSSLTDSLPIKIYYKLRSPVSLQFCNYSKFLKNLSLEKIRSICNSDCACSENKEFVYDFHGHVFTGDLDFVKDLKLKEIMQFGSKFRMDRVATWDEVFVNLEEDMLMNIRKFSRKYKVGTEAFLPWCDKVLEIIKNKIDKFKINKRLFNTNQVALRHLNAALGNLHKDFIISTVDKATNNFAFICKKFYVTVLLKELGFDDNLLPVGNITYLPVNDNKENVIKKHIYELDNIFKIKVNSKNSILPKIFWIPKLHKDPFKFRFIAGARNCTTKELSVLVNLGLKVIKENFRKYCLAIYRNSGFNFYWSINSTLEFINKIDKISVHTLQVYDFSTLYTNIDQEKILEHLFGVFQLVFNDRNRKYLCIRFDKAFFAGKTYASFECFDVDLFKKAVSFVIHEVYVHFGGLLFKQTKGIPMGGNSSPLLADLFLSHCEFLFMSSLVKNKKFGLVKLLSNTSRYIDDLCIVNYRHFDSLVGIIYPDDLIAERSGANDKVVDYLDVRLSIEESVLRLSVFHKVDNFNFPVILLTFPQSLIPLTLGHRVFAGQVLRYLRICSHLDDFIDKTRKTTVLLLHRGYKAFHLKFQLEKIISKNSLLLHKFGLFSARQISNLVGLCT